MLNRKIVTISEAAERKSVDAKPLPRVTVTDENNSVTNNIAADTVAFAQPYNKITRNNLFSASVKGRVKDEKAPSAYTQNKDQHFLHDFEQGLLASHRSVALPLNNAFKNNRAEIGDLDNGYTCVIR